MAAYVVYAVIDPQSVRVGVSGDPPTLAAYLRHRHLRGAGADGQAADGNRPPQLIVLSSPLAFRVAADIVNKFVRIKWWQSVAWPPFWRLAALRGLAWLLVKHGGGRPYWRLVPAADDFALSPAELHKARQWLAGRHLLHSEALRLLEQGGEGELSGDPLGLVEVLAWEGHVMRQAALTRSMVGRWSCHRCGARDKADAGYCAHCGTDDCASCTECAALGAARACQAVVIGKPMALPNRRREQWGAGRWVERPADRTAASLLHLSFSLSAAQLRASEALMAATGKRSVVWAACGAGKTEVVYGVMEQTLKLGHNVLFAVPRRDIAAELTERIAQAFPSVHCHGLYGGVVDKFSPAQLVVATTHQVLRFYERFPLIIVDEVDAFPYRGSAMLRRAVERALAPGGRLIYMTATPTETFLERVAAEGWTLVTIPARHHGWPLPVPRIVLEPALGALRQALDNGHTDVSLPTAVAAPVQRFVASGKPLLVFVPTVRLVDPTVAMLRSLLEGAGKAGSITVEGTHARDPHRDRRRQALQEGTLPVLVATTILERGVTIPGVNVMVLFANEHHLFDSATLIQMAGRAGRTAACPHGHVLFCAATKSQAMMHARRRIEQLNDEAAQLGFLHSG